MSQKCIRLAVNSDPCLDQLAEMDSLAASPGDAP